MKRYKLYTFKLWQRSSKNRLIVGLSVHMLKIVKNIKICYFDQFLSYKKNQNCLDGLLDLNTHQLNSKKPS